MSYDNVLLEQLEAGVYLLTINRPKSFNALNSATLDDLSAAISAVEADENARVLLLTGSGDKAFVAGADIAEMQEISCLQAREFSQKGIRTFRRLETLPIPTIALVNGFCLGGGCELAMSCDWILAAENAVFGQPEVSLGITAGFGGTQRLQRLIGRGRAMELLVTGRQIKADEALAWGLANHVYPADQLRDKAMKSVKAILGKGPVAVRLTKEAVQRGQDLDLENACILESEVFSLCFSSADQREGMTAFVEKRAADFKGV